jgi:hypothetical protein
MENPAELLLSLAFCQYKRLILYKIVPSTMKLRGKCLPLPFKFIFEENEKNSIYRNSLCAWRKDA